MGRAISCVILLLVTACGSAPEEPAPAAELAPAPEIAPAPGLTLPDAFPHSMKGYVLYGWERGGETWFTLITGTNRAKSFAELDEPNAQLGEDGWVQVRVQGIEQARDLLRRVPEGEAMVLGIDSPTLAGATLPDDVRPLDPAVLEALDAPR